MKSKLAFMALAVVCFCGMAKADTVDITASEFYGRVDGFNALPFVDLQIQLTVEPVIATDGEFFRVNFGPISAPTSGLEVLEVTGITGTLNGNPVSFLPASVGAGSWLFPETLGLGGLWFSSGGFDWLMGNDALNNLLSNDQTTTPIFYNPTIVNTPEPSSFMLLAIGLTGLAWRWFSIPPRRDRRQRGSC
jgi:hypothetical protein